MNLSKFNQYNSITIQCHDNPDADSIGSGYGLYLYFKSLGKQVRFVYSGMNKIQKSNLVLMLDKLGIDIDHVEPEFADCYDTGDVLITVDCQYGAGNVTKLPAKHVAIIDHHQREIEGYEDSYIMSDYGSCATVVWKLLLDQGFGIDDEKHLATALYYGLLTDTNNFAEIHNPIDMDMRDELPADRSMVTLFCNSNISLNELEIAGVAMIRYSYNDEHHYAVIKSQPCDPNILGLVSDFLLQVDKIHTCVVYNENGGGYKLSVRSCIREVNAGELAAFLTEGVGSGGGHYQKSGGFISRKLYADKYGPLSSEAYFHNRMNEYFNQFDLVYADKYEINKDDFEIYKKNHIPMGFVKASEMLPVGTPVLIRTIEGDVELVIEDDLIIMIGVEGEVYPSHIDKFNRAYREVDEKYDYEKMTINAKYVPMVKSRIDGTAVHMVDYARTCVSTGDVSIYAKPMERKTKVFTSWDKNRYMLGKIGDMLAVRTDDLHDVYIVDKTVFGVTYSK